MWQRDPTGSGAEGRARNVSSWWTAMFGAAVGGWGAAAVAALPYEISFSVDPASPAVGTVFAGGETLTPDDLLRPGPGLRREGSGLGMNDDFFGGDFDNLDAVSFGADRLEGPVWFSVDRLAVGRAGSAVAAEAGAVDPEAAADIFRALPPLGGNELAVDETTLGLAPGFFGDDLDALAFGRSERVYFSIDEFSAGNAFGADILAGNIYLDTLGDLFADAVHDLGLLAGDDLDALALWDTGRIGVLDPGLDKAWFSISARSPSALTSGGTVSPGAILETRFQGSFGVYATAESLGLRSDDDLDALATPVPDAGSSWEWGLGLGAVGFLVGRERRRAKPRSVAATSASPGFG